MRFRSPVNSHRIEEFLNQFGKRFRGAGQVYLVGGTTMVYEGFSKQTLDIELTFDLHPADHTDFIRICANSRRSYM